MAGTDRSSARASAVNPSRLPARPSGLRGLTAQRGQANESAVGHQCRTALTRREPLETMFFLENFLTREASYKPSYLTSWSQSGPLGTLMPMQNSNALTCRADKRAAPAMLAEHPRSLGERFRGRAR